MDNHFKVLVGEMGRAVVQVRVKLHGGMHWGQVWRNGGAGVWHGV